MKMKTIVVTLLLMLAMVLTLSANRVVIETHAQSAVLLLQDFCDDYAPVTLEDEDAYTASSTLVSISDFAGNSYYYTTVSPQGYIIMHAATQKVVEASFDDADPFEQISSTGTKFYAGPGQYFRKLQNESDEWVYRSYIGQDYALNDESLVSMSQTLNTQLTTAATEEENAAAPASVTSGSENTVTLNDGFTYIKDYMYFEKLIEMCQNKQIYDIESVSGDSQERVLPINLKGNCGFNSLAIVLNYLDIYKNSNIIPDVYKCVVAPSEHSDLNKDYTDIDQEDILYMQIVREDLATLLTQYIYPGYKVMSDNMDDSVFNGYPAAANTLSNALDSYIADKIGELSNNINNLTQSAQSMLSQGHPTILSIGLYYVVDDGWNYGHCVIAYGYKDSMYKVFEPNWGVSQIITSCLFYTAYSVEYDGEHIHSNGLKFKNHDSFGTYCPCGHKTCSHSSGLLNANHGCISCGVVYHPWIYTGVYTASMHQMKCTQCNVTFTGEHIFRPGPLGSVYCSCGYDSRDSGEITLGNPNYDEGM